MRIKSLILASSLLFVAAPAFAQDGGRIGEICKAEVAQLCTDATKGGGGVWRCLNENKAKLTGACQTAFNDAQAKRQAARAACADDAKKLCAGDAAKGEAQAGGKGGGQALQCLRTKVAEVTKPCADALAALPQGGKAK